MSRASPVRIETSIAPFGRRVLALVWSSNRGNLRFTSRLARRGSAIFRCATHPCARRHPSPLDIWWRRSQQHLEKNQTVWPRLELTCAGIVKLGRLTTSVAGLSQFDHLLARQCRARSPISAKSLARGGWASSQTRPRLHQRAIALDRTSQGDHFSASRRAGRTSPRRPGRSGVRCSPKRRMARRASPWFRPHWRGSCVSRAPSCRMLRCGGERPE